MDFLPKHSIMEFHPDTLEVVRKAYNLDKTGAMDEAIDILNEWVLKQNHFLKKSFPRSYLERVLIGSKGSVERAKVRLDKICTLRTLVPQFFGQYADIRNNDTIELFKANITIQLPKLTKEHDRVLLIIIRRGIQYEPSDFMTLHSFDNSSATSATAKHLQWENNYLLYCAEYYASHDYVNSYHIVVDMRELNVSELMSLTLACDMSSFRQALVIIMQGFGGRVKYIHWITSIKLVDTFITMCKLFLSDKLMKRLITHRNLESLYEFIPKAILPSEYGGDERSITQLDDEWVTVLSSHEFSEYQRELNAARTDESLRQTDTFNEQYMGMPGTFRTLRVD